MGRHLVTKTVKIAMVKLPKNISLVVMHGFQKRFIFSFPRTSFIAHHVQGSKGLLRSHSCVCKKKPSVFLNPPPIAKSSWRPPRDGAIVEKCFNWWQNLHGRKMSHMGLVTMFTLKWWLWCHFPEERESNHGPFDICTHFLEVYFFL